MIRRRTTCLLLLALVTGCSADVPAGPASQSGPPPAGTSAAAQAASSSASMKGAQAAETQSMCATGESVLFSCETTAGKSASLCASQDVARDHGHLYYAYGALGKPELVFPSERRPPTEFRRTHLTFAGSTGGYAFSFKNGTYRYIVYSISGAEGLEDQGILVTHGDPRTSIMTLVCRKGSVIESEDVALLDLTFAWPADQDLEQHGLPHRD